MIALNGFIMFSLLLFGATCVSAHESVVCYLAQIRAMIALNGFILLSLLLLGVTYVGTHELVVCYLA